VIYLTLKKPTYCRAIPANPAANVLM
jgi:hypothetical protein